MRSISINNLFPPHTWRNLATPALTGKVLLDSGINATTLQYDFKQENHSIKVSNVIVITKTMRVRHLKTRTRTQNPKTKLCCFSLPLFPPTIYHHQSYFHILNCNLSESSFKEEGSKDTVMSKYRLSPLRRVKNMPSPLNCISDKPSSNPQHRHHSQESILRQQRPQPHPLHISATRTSLTLTENRQTNHARQLLFKIKLALLPII